MPQHETKTSFKPGNKRSKESIEKQRETMKEQYRDGLRKPPKCKWTPNKIKKMLEASRSSKLISNPIGSRRKHNAGKGLTYWVVKVSDRGRWKYEHRLILESKIRRKLTKHEIVHHLNKNTLDNRIGNLCVMNNIKHLQGHRKHII
jgi:hypothetical protein